MNNDDRRNRHSKWIVVSIILFIICIFLSATLVILYVKQAPPQRILQRIGFNNSKEIDWTLISWNSSLKQLEYDSDIVFIGDSLTSGENFQEYFKNQKIVNLGISGDKISGLSERSYIIKELSPEKIFIEVGINTLKSSNVNDLSVLSESMVVDIIVSNPDASLFIQSILPISNSAQKGRLNNENIIEMNKRIKDIANRHGATYVDIYSVYVLNNEINPEYTKDGIHLKDEYKNLWLDALSQYIE